MKTTFKVCPYTNNFLFSFLRSYLLPHFFFVHLTTVSYRPITKSSVKSLALPLNSLQHGKKINKLGILALFLAINQLTALSSPMLIKTDHSPGILYFQISIHHLPRDPSGLSWIWSLLPRVPVIFIICWNISSSSFLRKSEKKVKTLGALHVTKSPLSQCSDNFGRVSKALLCYFVFWCCSWRMY